MYSRAQRLSHLLLPALVLAWGPVLAEEGPEPKPSSTEQVSRLLDEQEPEGDTLVLELADPLHYQLVVERLHASGNTPDNSPRLYERLERARRVAVEEKPGALATSECAHTAELTAEPVPGTVLYTGRALVGCRLSSQDYVFADVSAWQEQAEGGGLRLLARRSAEDYTGGGRFEDAAVDFTYNRKEGQRLQVDSLMLAFDDARGAFRGSYTRHYLTGELEGAGEARVKSLVESLTLSHPREITGGNPIRICVNRGLYTGVSDCDYGSIASTYQLWPRFWPEVENPWAMAPDSNGADLTWTADTANVFAPSAAWDMSRTYVPIQGVLDAGSNNGSTLCTVASINYAKAELFYMGTDMTCGYANGALVASANLGGIFPTTKNTSSFKTLGNFGTLCGDTPYLFNQKQFRLRLTVGYNRKCSTVTEARVKILNYGPTLDFRNSCFAEGTKVLLADGSSKAIEQVGLGDRVVADEGKVLTVTALGRGGEPGLLVRLRTDKGHEVSVTAKHPVLTPQGAVTADSLRKGDAVLSREGVATLTRVSREPSRTLVYNLQLGTPEELEQVGSHTTLFANGLLMGDHRMQVAVEERSAKALATRSHAVSKAWRQDYRNDVARGARVR